MYTLISKNSLISRKIIIRHTLLLEEWPKHLQSPKTNTEVTINFENSQSIINNLERLHLPINSAKIAILKNLLLRYGAQNELDFWIKKLAQASQKWDTQKILEALRWVIWSLVSISQIKSYSNGLNERQLRKDLLDEDLVDYPWMSNIDGKIRFINIQYSRETLPTITSLIKANQNNPDFTINVLVNNSSEMIQFHDVVEKFWNWNNEILCNIQVRVVGSSHESIKNSEIWIRDTWIFLNWKEKPIILEPKIHPHNNDQHNILGHQLNLEIRQSDLFFEGGNMRQTKEHAFIGMTNIIINTTTGEEILKEIQENNWVYFNKKNALGSLLGLLTGAKIPTGKDEKFWRDILRKVSNIKPSEITEVKDRFEKLLWKRAIIIWENTKEDFSQINSKTYQPFYHVDLFMTPIDEKTILLPDNSDGSFTQVIQSLRKEWFTVISELPFIRYLGKWWVTYNNALIEKYMDSEWKQRKKVYMPWYSPEEFIQWNSSQEVSPKDIERMNSKAKEVYERLWFEVIPISVSIWVLNGRWSLNCITNEWR